MSIRQRAYEMWIWSPFFTFHKRDREMAYLVDYWTWDALRMDASPHMISCFDAYGQTLYGWPVYIGTYAPPEGILFLPERTVRSMSGMVPA